LRLLGPVEQVNTSDNRSGIIRGKQRLPSQSQYSRWAVRFVPSILMNANLFIFK